MSEKKIPNKFDDPLELKKAIENADDTKQKRKKKDWLVINLRMNPSLLQEIDMMREDRPEISRNSWIIEAVREKIKRKE